MRSLIFNPPRDLTGHGCIIQVERVDFHRNGVSGEPFHVVRFTHTPDRRNPLPLMAIVFEEPGNVAVFRTGPMDEDDGLDFAVNSWRGYVFEPVLRKAVAIYEETV